MPKIIFTDEQVKEMRYLHNELGLSWCAIGARFGVSRTTAKCAADAKYAARRKEQEQLKGKSGRRDAHLGWGKISVPQSVENDRQRRLNAPYRSPAAALLGEPPIGFSALDRKMAGVSA